MSILYRIDRQIGITYTVWAGLVTAAEFLTHARKLTSDPDWPPYRRLHIADLLNASTDASIDPETLLKAAGIFAEKPETISNMKAAVVASEIFMKATAFERLMATTQLSIIVFNGLDTACKWLGIDSAETKNALQDLRVQK